MDGSICYLNTDLDLASTDDLNELARPLTTAGLFALHVSQGDDGIWRATFETERQYSEPEQNIAAMLSAAESLADAPRSAWTKCKQREFNIGYDCGSGPWAFNHGLSSELLGRMAALGTSLRITLYPQSARTAKWTHQRNAEGDND